MFEKHNNKTSGFTLLELMVVVAVIGVLASVAFPSYQQTIRETSRSDAYDALLECASSQARRYTTSAQPSYLTEAQAATAGICLDSKEGFYTLVVANNNCSTTVGSNTLNWCFTVTATAVGGQLGDTQCRTLSVDHTGRKSAADDNNVDNTAECWRS